MSDSVAGFANHKAGKMRQEQPDTMLAVVLLDRGNNTYDVARPGWESGRKLTRITNINPDLAGQIHEDDTVLLGAYNGNRQQWSILSKAGFLLTAQVTDSTVTPGTAYLAALPLAELQWAVQGHDDQRSRFSGRADKHWALDPYGDGLSSFPLAATPLCSLPRVAQNRVVLVVDGEDGDARVASKVQVVEEQLPTTAGNQENPYFLRVCHVNVSQQLESDPEGNAGNGDPGDFAANLHIWDLKLNRSLGISWSGEVGVVPVDVSIQPFVCREGTPDVEERVYVTVLWAAPETQPPGGRKPSSDREDPDPHWLDSGSGRFWISRYLVNLRHSYVFTGTEEYQAIKHHPLWTQGEVSEQGHVLGLSTVAEVYSEESSAYVAASSLLNYVTVQHHPALETRFYTELERMPLGSPIFRGEDLATVPAGDSSRDWCVIICGQRSSEAGLSPDLSCIETLQAVRVSAEDASYTPGGVVLDSTDLALAAADFSWPPEAVNFFAERPTDDVGPVPWFSSSFKFGDDFVAGMGLVRNGGYLLDFLVHRTGNPAARGDVFVIPRWSYSPQVVAFKVTDVGATTVDWTIQGWTGHPATTRFYTVCGLFNDTEGMVDSEVPVLLLVHFEEFTQQSASSIWAPKEDWTGMIAYEQAQGFPTPGSDDFFDVSEWPPSGYDFAYQTDDPDGATSLTEVDRMFGWTKAYWEGRNDSTGWTNISTDQMPASRTHGFMVVNPATGEVLNEDYFLTTDSTLSVKTGDITVEWFVSAFVAGAEDGIAGEDPAEVSDTYGPVYSWSDPSISVTGTEEFGCVPPLASGEEELLRKVWLLKYDIASLTPSVTYDDPIFKYAVSLPSYDTGEPLLNSGEALVTLSMGEHSSQVGFEVDDPSDPRFGAVSWGRRFVVLRIKVGTANFDYTNSCKIPFSPTKAAFLNEVASFLMASRTWPGTPAAEQTL